MKKKNLTLSIILSLIFGPIGLLYSSIIAGIAAIIFSVFFAVALIIAGGFEVEYITLFPGLVIQPIIIAWGALIVKENNYLVDTGKNSSSEFETKLLYEAIQIYLISLALCFTLIAVLTQFNDENFMQKSIFPSIIVVTLIMITLIVTFKKDSPSLINKSEENIA